MHALPLETMARGEGATGAKTQMLGVEQSDERLNSIRNQIPLKMDEGLRRLNPLRHAHPERLRDAR